MNLARSPLPATAMLDSGVQLAYQCCRVPNGSGEDLFHYFWPAHDRRRNYRLSQSWQRGVPEHRVAGLATALIVSLLLAAQFVPKFIRTGRIMPAGMMSVLSVIGIIAAIIAWVRK